MDSFGDNPMFDSVSEVVTALRGTDMAFTLAVMAGVNPEVVLREVLEMSTDEEVASVLQSMKDAGKWFDDSTLTDEERAIVGTFTIRHIIEFSVRWEEILFIRDALSKLSGEQAAEIEGMRVESYEDAAKDVLEGTRPEVDSPNCPECVTCSSRHICWPDTFSTPAF